MSIGTTPISRRFAAAVLVVALLALATYGVAEQSPLVAGLAMLAAVSGWWYTETRPGRGLPRWLVGCTLGVVVLLGIREAMGPVGLTVSPFAGFLAAIIVLKLWERRQPRDYAQVLSISLFLNVGAMLNSSTLGVGVLLLLNIPAMTYAVMLLQVVAGRARAEEARSRTGAVPEAAPTVAAQMLPATWAGQMNRLAAFAVVAGLAISLGVFIILPRGVGTGGLTGLVRSGQNVSGFSDRVDLTEGGLISESQAIALEVEIQGERGVGQLLAEGGELYLRGAVLDEYVRGAWERRGTGESVTIDITQPRGTTKATTLVINETPSTRVLVRDFTGGDRRPLFVPFRSTAIKVGENAEAIKYDQGTEALWATWRGSLEYTAWVAPPSNGARDDIPSWAADPRGKSRSVITFDSARVRDYADTVLRGAGVVPDPSSRPPREDEAAVKALEEHLRTKFAYTTNVLAAPPGRDPIEWFLHDSRRGHCAYFAGALAAMCRSVGIDARVIAGYAASEFDPEQRTFTIRQANAHAWVEARVGPGLWKTFDGTPAAELARIVAPRPGFTASVERFLDQIQAFWGRAVVSYDENTRASLFGGIRERIESAAKGTSAKGLLSSLLDFLSSRPIALGAGCALIAIWVFTFVRRFKSAGRGEPRPTMALKGLEGRLYRRALKALASRGSPKPFWRAPLDHADAIEGRDPEGAQTLRRVAGTLYGRWFGGRDAASLAELDAALDRLDRSPQPVGER